MTSTVATLSKPKKTDGVPIKKNVDVNSDSEIIPVKKKELIARLEGEELRFNACYADCVKYAAEVNASNEIADTYKKVLEINEPKFKELVNERNILKNECDLLKNELSIFKSKTSQMSKAIESKKTHTKTAEEFNKDVQSEEIKDKERLNTLKQSIKNRYILFEK